MISSTILPSSLLNSPNPLEGSIEGIASLLQEVAQDSNQFYSIFNQSFGSAFNSSLAETIRSQWAIADFSAIPTIQVLSEGMDGVYGAYAISTNTIYISQSLVTLGQPELLNSVLLEEIGHALDAQLNPTDTIGEEGQLFSALTRGESLTPEQLAALRSENHFGTISVNGQPIVVEMAPPITTTWTVGTFAELVTALKDSKNNGTADVIDLTADITITGQLPLINEDVGLTLNGNNFKLDGGNSQRLLFIKSGTVDLLRKSNKVVQ